ncbi:LysR family transcriptional regulator [Siculibacillus lacustris]|uniref:LysR family transcriptional regulator n=1 Tax=Siculibacillus lacustris TaxID=1549641 RepID=A0A4Q9VRK7_9HYPH|nr:LysR substrate-binding domain-containing protein [Siculibacillus lacustris]TBW38254.1 LysR family transcriptional regulator [Siculibacillus lacustris]
MTRELPSFRSLRALEAVVRQGNVVRAAEDLGVTPGALSKHLSQLARDLGVALFEPGHRLVPTEAAQDLAAAVGAAIGLLRRACDDVTTARGRGVLTVTANASLAMHWLVPRVLAAQTAIGGRQIRVHAVHSTDDWRQLPFDLAIRRGGAVPPGFAGRVLGRERLTLLAAPGRAARLVAGGLAALAGETLLIARTRIGEVEAWTSAARVPAPPTLRSLPHFYLAIEAALADQGVIVGPPWLATDVHHDRLIMPFPEIVALGTPLVGIWDPTRGDGPTLALLLDWIAAEMNLAPTGVPTAIA